MNRSVNIVRFDMTLFVLTLSGEALILGAGDPGMRTRAVRAEKLDLRLTSEAKRTIQAAAAAVRRSVSDFVLESALTKAGEALADRREFFLSPKQWKTFLAALDAPPRELPRLKRLMSEPGFFDAE